MKYAPGTKLTVGHHQVSIIKYISEGGFAHVYTCNIEPAFNNCTVACLKRVVVPNKLQLTLLRQEVDAMRRLRGNPTIVSYIDLHAARYKPHPGENSLNGEQQYEVFLLMEYCSNNGLIDFMNQRLVHKLTEPEILQIMYDVTSAVAMCHHLKPPLIHRDIKIENVLIDVNHRYKLADFGSAVPYAAAPKNKQEYDSLKEDVMYHTTPQYRAPEMIDLSRGFPIDDKADIWALGCFLYKLCYYTTPFERPTQKSLQELDQLILHADSSLRFNDQPGSIFSPRLKNIVKVCLREDPRRRPNAVQVLTEVCNMLNVAVPNVIPTSVTLSQQQLQPLLQPGAGVSQPVSPQKKSSEDLTKTKSKTTDQPHVEPKNTLSSSKSNSSFAREGTPKVLRNLVKSPAPSTKSSSSPGPQNPKFREVLQSATSNRPLSYVGPLFTDDRSKSSTSLQSFVHSQLENEELYTFENDVNDLDFLRTKELELQQRHPTGGSIKMSLYNGLKRIGTGNSNLSVSSLNNQDTGPSTSKNNRRSSITSIKQILTGGGSSRKSSLQKPVEDYNSEPEYEKKPTRRNSIQNRMKMLMKSKEAPVPKTAKGYGKFSDNNNNNHSTNNDHHSLEPVQKLHIEKARTKETTTNKRDLVPPKIPASLSSKKSSEESKSTSNTLGRKSASEPPSKPVKKAPPKPKKPKQLHDTTNGHSQDTRRFSNGSIDSVPDVDDLERQFAKRYPTLKLA